MATAKKTQTKAAPPSKANPPEASPQLALPDEELKRAVSELGREPTAEEQAILAVMWSERESQKSSRNHTRRLPRTGAHVVRSAQQHAGVVDLGDGYSAVLSLTTVSGRDPARAATHAAGAALRHVVAAGCEPFALLDAIKLGGHQADTTPDALRDLATRLGSYVKDVNVPVVGGNLQFDPRCGDELVEQAVAVGVMRTERLVDDGASGLGNTLVCAGAVRSPSEESASDAFAQRRLSAGCLAAFETGAIAGAMGVAGSGVVGAAARLADNGATGFEIDADAIPQRSAGLSAVDALCTPGSEQLLLVVRKGREETVLKGLAAHDVEAQVIGRVTNTGHLVCRTGNGAGAKQNVVADLPVALLTRDTPAYERPLKQGTVEPALPEIKLRRNEDEESELVRLLSSPNLGSRDWLIKRLEQSARASAKGPAGDAAVLSIPCDDDQTKLLAISVDGDARHSAIDPKLGAAMAVAECARNLACVGAEPLGLAHGLALGGTEDEETSWRLSEAIDGLHEACLALKLPVVAGSVCLTEGTVPATPTIAVVGQLRSEQDRLGLAFGRQADMVALIGEVGGNNLAGAEFMSARSDAPCGKPVGIDLAAEVKLQRALLELSRERLLSSAHDVSDGGVGTALAECCIEGRIGCSIELPAAEGASVLELLFHEKPSRVVVSFPPEQRAKVEERCTALGVPFALLGFVGGDTLEIENVMDVPVQVLADSYSRALERLFQD